jgi:hypothetical protein
MRGLKKDVLRNSSYGILGETMKASSANNRNDPSDRRRGQVQTASAIDTTGGWGRGSTLDFPHQNEASYEQRVF